MSKKVSVILLSLTIISILLVILGSSVGAAPQGAWIKDPANPVLEPGPEGSWDQNAIWGQVIIKDDVTYKMWYTGYDANWNTAAGYATSGDGVTWEKYASNPVLTTGPSGSWDSRLIFDPTVIKNGAAYEMWYWAFDNDGNAAIGHTTSPDGYIWTKDPANPVMEPGAPGEWDEFQVRYPSVLYDAGSNLYRMWFWGIGNEGSAIGYAYSPDGVTWSKHSSNPILYPGPDGSWDGDGIYYPRVIRDGEVYKMWYSGFGLADYGVGYAVAAPGGWVTGHVYGETSSPLVDARIYALDSNLNIIASTVSEADGSYALVDLPADDYYLEINVAGYGREYYADSHDIAGTTAVSVTVPITTTGIDFTLAAGGGIGGHIFAPDGNTPFDGAMVEVKPAGGGRAMETVSGEDGAYTINDLASGSYDAWVGFGSYLASVAETPVSVTQPYTTTAVDFTLFGPYFPLRNEGDIYHYTWSNDVRHPAPIAERWQIMGENWEGRGGYAVSATSAQTLSKLWFQDAPAGVRLSGWSVNAYTGDFPNFMVGVGTYLVTPMKRSLWLPGPSPVSCASTPSSAAQTIIFPASGMCGLRRQWG